MQQASQFNILPTSRSAMECKRECEYKRYLNFFYDGTGIVPARYNVPMSTGICTHAGTEYLLRWMKKTDMIVQMTYPDSLQKVIEEAAQIGVAKYDEIVKAYWEKEGTNRQRSKEDDYLIAEQSALTEALIRAWGLVELPRLGRRFRVLDVELEEQLPLDAWVDGKQVVDLARVDAILQDRSSKDWFNYSLKTQKSWYDVAELRLKISLQAAIECMAVEHRLKQDKLDLKSMFALAIKHGVKDYAKLIKEKHDSIPKQLMGTKSCFLIKGDRKESKYEKGHYITYNSLIRGYKKETPASIGKKASFEYAWSWQTVKAENKSGMGTLGKGWEPFNVWEEMGVKKWIEMIQGGLQKECGNPFNEIVRSPTEWFRRQQVLDLVYVQVSQEEQETFEKIKKYYGDAEQIRRHFPMEQDSCYPFTNYPCPYLIICNNGNNEYREHIANDPIGSGDFVKRTPHHELERRMLCPTE